MVENIRLNRDLPSVSTTERIKRLDRRRQSNQHPPFKEAFQEKEEKEKRKGDNQDIGGKFENSTTLERAEQKRNEGMRDADDDRQSVGPPEKKIIDIRV